jgi:transposase
VVFVDESGFMLQPLVRRTWAPRGQTPILRQWDRRDRLSTISAITLAPLRRRFGLYWAQYPHNIRSAEVLRFLQGLGRHLPKGFTLIWDRGQTHRAKQVETWLAKHRRVVVEWLPPYAPDLNPVEMVWSHSKYGDLANHAPESFQDLEHAFLDSMCRTKGQRSLLSAFFKGAGLEL